VEDRGMENTIRLFFDNNTLMMILMCAIERLWNRGFSMRDYQNGDLSWILHDLGSACAALSGLLPRFVRNPRAYALGFPTPPLRGLSLALKGRRRIAQGVSPGDRADSAREALQGRSRTALDFKDEMRGAGSVRAFIPRTAQPKCHIHSGTR